MPYWTHEQENMLADMVEQGKTVEEICVQFHRSPEAVRLKEWVSGFQQAIKLLQGPQQRHCWKHCHLLQRGGLSPFEVKRYIKLGLDRKR